jgi:hypothetical protein
MQFRGNFQEFAITRLPDFKERARVEPAFHRAPAVKPLLEGLVHQILFEALAAGVLKDSGQPHEFLMIEPGERVLGVGHEAIEI